MPVINSISNMKIEMQKWRQDLHTFPELGFEEKKTSDFIAEKLEEFGIEFYRDIAKTGIVGVIHGSKPGSGAIGLRADMDALPMLEENNFKYISQNKGKMHACGHDGHTTMLLGAAKYLSQTKNFSGTVYLIFQPAEEGLGGGRVMVEEGLFKKFPMRSVWGMHNWPGLDVGKAAIHQGTVMASSDSVFISITGRGSHAAIPHLALDPVPVAASIITGLQNLVSRQTDPLKTVVLSITMLNAGTAFNIIPDKVEMRGTCRTMDEEDRNRLEISIKKVSQNIAEGFGLKAEVEYEKGFPATVNTINEAQQAVGVVKDVLGVDSADTTMPPSMVSEDFSYMLQECPGAYILLGAGHPGSDKMLHNSKYDFNDEILPMGASYWSRLVEMQLPK